MPAKAKKPGRAHKQVKKIATGKAFAKLKKPKGVV